MDSWRRINNYMKEKANPPWPIGFNEEQASRDAILAWEMLSAEERLVVSKHNLFYRVRDDKLCELHKEGLSVRILVELSGLSETAIYKMLNLRKLKAG